MAEKSVMVKDARTIETLGSITVIASDKTGTLTQNRMTSTHAIFSNAIVTLDQTLNDENSKYEISSESPLPVLTAPSACDPPRCRNLPQLQSHR